jgi:hypothetical protein
MKTVTAYEDESGVLHRTTKAARDADGRRVFEDALKACTSDTFDLDRFIEMIRKSPLLRETVVQYLMHI